MYFSKKIYVDIICHSRVFQLIKGNDKRNVILITGEYEKLGNIPSSNIRS